MTLDRQVYHVLATIYQLIDHAFALGRLCKGCGWGEDTMAHCLSEEKDARQPTVSRVSHVISHLLLPEGDPLRLQLMEHQ